MFEYVGIIYNCRIIYIVVYKFVVSRDWWMDN